MKSFPIQAPPTAIYYQTHQKNEKEGVSIYCTASVYHQINKHVSADLEREYGGFLLGAIFQEAPGKIYIVIDCATPAQFTKADEVRLNFTHETFLQLAQERSTLFPEKEVLGWYHSHPKMDIFLSSLDVWIHEGFFKEEYKVALVVEPQKNLGGFFKRIQQKLDPHTCFGFYLIQEDRELSRSELWNNVENELAEQSAGNESFSQPQKKGGYFSLIHILILFMLGLVIFPLLLHLNSLQRSQLLNQQIFYLREDLQDFQKNQQKDILEIQIDLKRSELEMIKLYKVLQEVEQMTHQEVKIQLEIEKNREKMVREMRQMKRELFRQQTTLMDHLFRLERGLNLLFQQMERQIPDQTIFKKILLFYNFFQSFSALEKQSKKFKAQIQSLLWPNVPNSEEKDNK